MSCAATWEEFGPEAKSLTARGKGLVRMPEYLTARGEGLVRMPESLTARGEGLVRRPESLTAWHGGEVGSAAAAAPDSASNGR